MGEHSHSMSVTKQKIGTWKGLGILYGRKTMCDLGTQFCDPNAQNATVFHISFHSSQVFSFVKIVVCHRYIQKHVFLFRKYSLTILQTHTLTNNYYSYPRWFTSPPEVWLNSFIQQVPSTVSFILSYLLPYVFNRSYACEVSFAKSKGKCQDFTYCKNLSREQSSGRMCTILYSRSSSMTDKQGLEQVPCRKICWL